MADTIFQVGYGRADITPDYNTHMQGGDWRNRISTGVLDHLYATCIALTVGQDTVLLYTVDLKLVTKNFSEVSRDVISQATGVPRERIFLNATHTHSSVAIRYGWDRVEEYRAFFNQAAVKAAEEALADRAPCQILAGVTETEGLNFVRHYRTNAGGVCGSNFGDHSSGYACHVKEPDRQMQVVKLCREGKKDILMVSFPCHGTFKEGGTLFSADYIGPARAYAEANCDCHFAFFQAACGDQTPGSRIPGLAIKDYEVHGTRVAQAALSAELKPLDAGQIKLHTILFTGNTNKKNMDKLEDAKKVLEVAATYGNRSEELKVALKQYGLHSRHEANWLTIRDRVGDTVSMELGVLSIGQLSFVLAPYEMFGEQGRYIKNNTPFPMTFIIGCGDGGYNYLASKEAFDYDCYESQCCFFERGTAEQLADIYLEMLEKVK